MFKFLSHVSPALANFFGTVAAKYRLHLDNANAQARAVAQANNAAFLTAVARPEYVLYAQVMMEAINNIADAAALHTANRLSQVMTKDWLGQIPCGLNCFRYRARRLYRCTLSRDEINRILQAEIDQLCSFNGYHKVVVYVRFGLDKELFLEMIYVADAHRYRMEQLKGVKI